MFFVYSIHKYIHIHIHRYMHIKIAVDGASGGGGVCGETFADKM